MRLDVQPIEDAVVAALAAAVVLKTEPCPGDPEDFTPSAARGHALVSFGGADWPPEDALDQRPSRVAFDVQLFTKSLRTNAGDRGGAYAAIGDASEALSELVVGPLVFKPDNARYIDRRGGYWVYGFRAIGTRPDGLQTPDVR